MKNISTLMTAAFLIAACRSDEIRTDLKDAGSSATHINVLTEKEKAEGWKLLFDGKSKNGWHIYLNETDGSAWKSLDGVLYLDASEFDGWQTKNGGDLVTDSVYENFHFYLEWKISEGGNSGILFNVQEDPKYSYTWFTGPEMQILDNYNHPDGKVNMRRAGDLVGLMRCSKEPAHGPGRWNTTDIRVENGNLDMFINGKHILSTRIGDGYWHKLVKQSEFRYSSDFGMFTKGRIALQDHGYPVWFRNIRIREL
jgi:hypothetical protein